MSNTAFDTPGAQVDVVGLSAADMSLDDSLLLYDLSLTANAKLALDRLLGFIPDIPGGRLTTESGVPVSVCTVTSRTAQATVYYAFYNHDKIKIWDGTRWKAYTFTELSNVLANTATGKAGPTAVVTDKNYDMYVWDDAGTLRLTRSETWDVGGGSDVLRGTGAGSSERQRINGVWTNKYAITNGPAANCGRYVGSIRGTGSSTTEDSMWKRLVWNAYNQIDLAMHRSMQDNDNANTVGTETHVALTNQANLFLMVLTGNDGSAVDLSAAIVGKNDTVTVNWSCGIGIGSATACPVAGVAGPVAGATAGYATIALRYVDTKVAGYQIYYIAIDNGSGAATTTFIKDIGGSNSENWSGGDAACTYLSGKVLG
jgi:hypothetical protein